MVEEKGISFRDILIGIAIGAVLVFLVLRKQSATLGTNTNTNLIGLSGLEQRMNSMEQKFDMFTQNMHQSTSSKQTVYTNKMHIVRDANGDIVDIIRDAKIGNG